MIDAGVRSRIFFALSCIIFCQNGVNNMGKYFGTDGFRGKAGEGLTAQHAYEIGRFLGCFLQPLF